MPERSFRGVRMSRLKDIASGLHVPEGRPVAPFDAST